MLHSHINHAQEKQDRDVQALHHSITLNRNALAIALDNDDMVTFDKLQHEYEKLSLLLG